MINVAGRKKIVSYREIAKNDYPGMFSDDTPVPKVHPPNHLEVDMM